jgi:hypothetical protein
LWCLGRLGRLAKRSLATRHAVGPFVLRGVALRYRWLAGWRLALIRMALPSLWELLRYNHRLGLLAGLGWKRGVNDTLGCLRRIHVDNLLRLLWCLM